MFIQTLHSSQSAGRLGYFGNFYLAVSLEAHACFDIEWVQFVFQNYETLHSGRGLYGMKNSAS